MVEKEEGEKWRETRGEQVENAGEEAKLDKDTTFIWLNIWVIKSSRLKDTSLRIGVTMWTMHDVLLTVETDSSVTSFSTSMTEM